MIAAYRFADTLLNRSARSRLSWPLRPFPCSPAAALALVVPVVLVVLSVSAVRAEETNLTLSITDAVLLALAKNPSIAIEKQATPIARTFEQEQRAAFDPVLGYGAGRGQSDSTRLPTVGTNSFNGVFRGDGANLTLGTLLPLGTRLALGGSVSNQVFNGNDPFYATRVGVSAVQPLLNGAGSAVNFAPRKFATPV